MSFITNAEVFSDGYKMLRLALRLDAVITGVNGLAYLTLFSPLEEYLGLDATVSVLLGVFLVVYALAVWAVSLPTVARRMAVNAIIEANVGWALLSVAAVALGWLSLEMVGDVWAVMQAIVVLGFAGLQYVALRRVG